jgi:hypothetical protein
LNTKNKGIEEIIWVGLILLQIPIYLFYTSLQSVPYSSFIYLIASILNYPFVGFLLAFCIKGRFRDRRPQGQKDLLVVLAILLFFGILVEWFLWILLYPLHVMMLVIVGLTVIWSAIKYIKLQTNLIT